MGLPEPRSCCFCFDTKTGSLILASLNLIGAILGIVLACSGVLAFIIEAPLAPLVQKHILDDEQMRNIGLLVCIAALTFCCICGLCSILLIHGIRKDRPGLMLPYLVLDRFIIILVMIEIFAASVLAIYIDIVIGAHPDFTSQHPFVIMHLVGVIGSLIIQVGLQVYFHLVINAYHKKVRRALSEDHSILINKL